MIKSPIVFKQKNELGWKKSLGNVLPEFYCRRRMGIPRPNARYLRWHNTTGLQKRKLNILFMAYHSFTSPFHSVWWSLFWWPTKKRVGQVEPQDDSVNIVQHILGFVIILLIFVLTGVLVSVGTKGRGLGLAPSAWACHFWSWDREKIWWKLSL